MQIDQSVTDRMVEAGIAECAETHFEGNTRRVRLALLRGQCHNCMYLSSSLVRQISDYLGQVDSRVKTVYQYEPVTAPGVSQQTDEGFSRKHAGIHLIAWVERKSAALNAVVETLKVVLAASLRTLGCPHASSDCYTLDIDIVDETDILERRGFGLLATSSYMRVQRIWSRAEKSEMTAHEEQDRIRYALPVWFDPDLVPESRLIEHAMTIERLPPEDRLGLEHHLTQLKVTLIRRIISDQLRYINLAKQWFTVADLAEIYQRRLGFGRIGGKSAGMLLADRILAQVAGRKLKESIRIPESYFLGSDLMYIFMSMNGLMHWNDQKYKAEEQIRADYPQIMDEFQAGNFPPEILVQLGDLLNQIGPHPIIVRSSSQLEDNLGTSFAGKYDSHFCPNQDTPEENLVALTRAIASTYASTFKPDALLYRRSKGLQDYDERMAVLIQPVEGEKLGRYYLPFGAGVAFSHNMYRWAPEIRHEDGFVRLVWGLGTHAVERVGNDYPHLVALSHPTLQPDDSPEAVRHYSQHFVDVIDLQENVLKTLPIGEVLTPDYAPIRFLVQLERDGYFVAPQMRVMRDDLLRLAITFDHMLKRTPFAGLMSETLHLLEQHCHSAVDLEFTVSISDPSASPSEVMISLLQCRPQSSLEVTEQVSLPEDLREADIVFSSHYIVPQGHLSNISHVIYVPPENYFTLSTESARHNVGRTVSRLNSLLKRKTFICIGPGRWGTTNSDLGVYVGYADICNVAALVELSGKGLGIGPEPSLGTHFFQDLMEAQIYPVAVPLDDPGTIFNRDFFYNTPSCLDKFAASDPGQADCLRLIEVTAFKPGHHLELFMDDEHGQAVAFLNPDSVTEL